MIMKKIIVFIICLLGINTAFGLNPHNFNNIKIENKSSSNLNINNNYQQFKIQVINFDTRNDVNYAGLRRRRKKDDKLMLYVAGGLAVATATLILTNNPDNFTSNNASGVNLGIAVGGTLACGMIVAKYFIDRRR